MLQFGIDRKLDKTSTLLDIPGSQRKYFWLSGLDAFEDSLFFGNQEIISNLNCILSISRDFLNSVSYPEVALPTYLQTSLRGARFLANCARPLKNNEQVIINTSNLRFKNPDIVKKYQKELERLQLPSLSKEAHKNEFILSLSNDPKAVLESELDSLQLTLSSFDFIPLKTGSGPDKRLQNFKKRVSQLQSKKSAVDDYESLRRDIRNLKAEIKNYRSIATEKERIQNLFFIKSSNGGYNSKKHESKAKQEREAIEFKEDLDLLKEKEDNRRRRKSNVNTGEEMRKIINLRKRSAPKVQEQNQQQSKQSKK